MHFVRLAGDAVDRRRQRVQQTTRGHRSRSGDPLYAARRTLHTGEKLLTQKQRARLAALFDVEEHVEVEVTWSTYQRMFTANRERDHAQGSEIMRGLIDSVSLGVPAPLAEVTTLGRTLKDWAVDVPAFFGLSRTRNGPTEAINGRFEHLRGSASGFRNLSAYIARSLLETRGFGPPIHPGLR